MQSQSFICPWIFRQKSTILKLVRQFLEVKYNSLLAHILMFAERHGFLLRPSYALFLFDGFGKKATDLETTFLKDVQVETRLNEIKFPVKVTRLICMYRCP